MFYDNQFTPEMAAKTGKIIALHLNYPSRTAERGRSPKAPGYFINPRTSLAFSGGTAERPAGCELMAYEGEIAIIIGKTARRVSREEAWDHVAYVTASNDLGVYDLRTADKGANVRSKGGDGFTPVGPTLLKAAEVDPAALRIRTWLNDELVQDDTTAELLFPFEVLVSDLSQLLTLEPGDMILTGTPAGASVCFPGDTVSVEVTTLDEAQSTGKLSTTITEGTVALPSYSAQPAADELQREEAWGSRRPEADRPKPTLTPELKAKLAGVATATLSANMRKRGLNNVSIDGLRCTKEGAKVVGTARTLRYVPNREDLFKAFGGGFNAQKRAIDSVNEGEILVMEARGEKGTGTVGDILAYRAQVRGAAAIITDGGVRDYTAVADLEIPTFFQNPHPAVLGRRHVPWDTDVTVACGGTTVQPGDIIVADEDGALVIPPAIAEELVEECLQQEHEEEFIFQMVGTGESVDGLYPMNAAWQEKYRQWATENPRVDPQP